MKKRMRNKQNQNERKQLYTVLPSCFDPRFHGDMAFRVGPDSRFCGKDEWTQRFRYKKTEVHSFPFLSQKGQSLIEALILSLALLTLFHFSLLTVWMGINILWMEHQLYQGVLCSAQQKNIKLCKGTVLKKIRNFNPLGKIKSLRITNSQKEWKGEILWRFYKKEFLIRQTLSLPP